MTHNIDRDYSGYTADQLRAAARRISEDLIRGQEMAGERGPRPEYVEQQQDLQRWMRNEAARRK